MVIGHTIFFFGRRPGRMPTTVTVYLTEADCLDVLKPHDGRRLAGREKKNGSLRLCSPAGGYAAPLFHNDRRWLINSTDAREVRRPYVIALGIFGGHFMDGSP